ncbi:hypothetical protein AYL99_10993 [Fonsecaea erecta]|uniref:FAD-binding domain-containing protein n=1 Tax=Fonsecaea erecta TaxID=1367422 RepID=A0A178Z662_9EURO|nr:hypothetical protein AYL99_10993 [Fonsecaea erecta]OAP54545.1 hypothetical protein AYL99_10993 [Fonsecaea erecta]
MSPSRTEHPTDRLRVVVVGAGLGGLAAAIAIYRSGLAEVQVLEAASKLGELGAGIQVSPNCSRLLIRWGVGKYLDDAVVLPRYGRVVRWQNGEVLSQAPMMPQIQEKYGFPHWHVHRADLHEALRRKVEELKIPILVNAKVVAADVEGASVSLHTGEKIDCDFIVGADGLRSTMREVVFQNEEAAPPFVTGDYAYRFTVPTEDMADDPVLADCVRVPMAIGWWGPRMHVVGYKLRNETIFNVVAVFPDDGTMDNTYKMEGEIEHLKKLYDGWCPQVKALIERAKPGTVTKWKLMDLPPLQRWHRGKLVLIGDACHPMLPMQAQGASQAIEDAAALAQCLRHLPLTDVGTVFQQLRYSRATQIQKYARTQRDKNHLLDGPEQEARDAAMKDASAAARSAYAWSWAAEDDEPARPWNEGLFGYDAEEEALKKIRKLGYPVKTE